MLESFDKTVKYDIVNAERRNEATKAIANLLDVCTNAPDFMELMRTQAVRLQKIEAVLCQMQAPVGEDCWLDAKEAAEYLSMSPGSFDRYRYKTNPHVKGYALDGKILYKKSDLDHFVKLYALKAEGVI